MQFGVADEAKIQARLDRIAATDAMDKARDLIVATGAKSGRVLEITDTAHHGWRSQADMARAMPKALLNIPVLPGDRIISAATEVTVEILTP